MIIRRVMTLKDKPNHNRNIKTNITSRNKLENRTPFKRDMVHLDEFKNRDSITEDMDFLVMGQLDFRTIPVAITSERALTLIMGRVDTSKTGLTPLAVELTFFSCFLFYRKEYFNIQNNVRVSNQVESN